MVSLVPFFFLFSLLFPLTLHDEEHLSRRAIHADC